MGVKETVAVLVGLFSPGAVGLSLLPPQERAEKIREKTNEERNKRARSFLMVCLAQRHSGRYPREQEKGSLLRYSI